MRPRPTTTARPALVRRCASLAAHRSFSVASPTSTRMNGDDPEAHDHLRLGPALELVVMMDRRHAEDALAGELERGHLQDHRDRLDHEDAAHDEQHDLLRTITAIDAERGAERERADVAHEHLRGIGVEPQEAEARADQRRAEDQQLAGAGHAGCRGTARRPRCRWHRRTRRARRPTITAGMIARPSSPSVRFTALLVPTITKYASAMNAAAPSGTATFLKNGRYSVVSAGVFAV